MSMKYKITTVPFSRTKETISYVLRTRRELFPMITDGSIPEDLWHFEMCYLENHTADFLIATDYQDRIVGTIGMRPYDHRFDHLHYKGINTVEVVKLYVDPLMRKKGLGTQLFQALKEQTFRKGTEIMYLHTHLFLKGAVEFWIKQGFVWVYQDEDPVYQTIHMECTLPGKNLVRHGLLKELELETDHL